MSPSSQSAPAEPLLAATIMLVREREERLQVYLMQRHGSSDFGGSYAFPGGLVDAADDSTAAEALCLGFTRRQAAERLRDCASPLAMYLAAIRECFEECGVFLGLERQGSDWRPVTVARQQTLARYRGPLIRKELCLADLCAEENLRLDASGLYYFSFWTTPVVRQRRYATRFFVAPMPEAQEPLVDKREAVDEVWLGLDEASIVQLAARQDLRPPTLANLRELAAFDSLSTLLETTASKPPHAIPEITPVVSFRDGRQSFSLHSRYPDQVPGHV